MLASIGLLAITVIALGLILGLIRPARILGLLVGFVLILSLAPAAIAAVQGFLPSLSPGSRFLFLGFLISAVVLCGIRLLFGRDVYAGVMSSLLYDVIHSSVRVFTWIVAPFARLLGFSVGWLLRIIVGP